jgi:hypothetical protein
VWTSVTTVCNTASRLDCADLTTPAVLGEVTTDSGLAATLIVECVTEVSVDGRPMSLMPAVEPRPSDSSDLAFNSSLTVALDAYRPAGVRPTMVPAFLEHNAPELIKFYKQIADNMRACVKAFLTHLHTCSIKFLLTNLLRTQNTLIQWKSTLQTAIGH